MHEAKTELEREIHSSAITAGDFNTPLSIMERPDKK